MKALRLGIYLFGSCGVLALANTSLRAQKILGMEPSTSLGILGLIGLAGIVTTITLLVRMAPVHPPKPSKGNP